MLDYSGTANHELFDLRSVVTIVEVYDLINLFSLNFYVTSTCNFAGPLYIEVTRLISKEGTQKSYYSISRLNI
jgi:hypothetical protein